MFPQINQTCRFSCKQRTYGMDKNRKSTFACCFLKGKRWHVFQGGAFPSLRGMYQMREVDGDLVPPKSCLFPERVYSIHGYTVYCISRIYYILRVSHHWRWESNFIIIMYFNVTLLYTKGLIMNLYSPTMISRARIHLRWYWILWFTRRILVMIPGVQTFLWLGHFLGE